uniref:EXS domain-containing protein n=1 Tax=Salix viminalis TaxID=40686 RepID=A0A6N2MJZ3_SALVM
MAREEEGRERRERASAIKSMFGGQVIPPSNSPHLRKSGSRPVVFELDKAEGNVEMEALLHSAELNDLKIASLPINTAAITPSPILLWRFKVGWDSVMRMSVNLRDLFLYEAFLYYNPLLLVTMMVWLWGVNLWVFAQSTISYAKIFDLDQNHLTHREIWKAATWMTIIVPTSMTAYLYLYSHGEVSLAASQPAITFADFFVADILTSMSKMWSVQFVEWSIARLPL